MSKLLLTLVCMVAAGLASGDDHTRLVRQLTKAERKLARVSVMTGGLEWKVDVVTSALRESAAGFFRDSWKALEAATSFDRLKQIATAARLRNAGEICRQVGFEILVPIARASDNLHKVRSVVKEAARVHGELCEGFFTGEAAAEFWQECSSSMEWTALPFLAEWLATKVLGRELGHVINAGNIQSQSVHLHWLIRHRLRTEMSQDITSDLVRLLVATLPDHRYRTEPQAAAADMETYLIAPCRQLVDVTGPKYFELLAVDLEALGRDLQPVAGANRLVVLDKIEDLYKQWLNYRICQSLILPNAKELVEGAPLAARSIVSG